MRPATGDAFISPDGLYRYTLTRTWDPGLPRVLWIMLNPSTADAETDDPTIRRCIAFSAAEGFGSLKVVNLYALRCTKPEHLLDHPDPEGPLNPDAWRAGIAEAHTVVAAWGARADELTPKGLPPSRALLNAVGEVDFQCLGTTKEHYPRHPLYVKGTTWLEPLR